LFFRDRIQFRDILPCRGEPNWRPVKPVPNRAWSYPDVNVVTVRGDVRRLPGGAVVREPDTTLAGLHSDALKLRVHHGLAQPWGTPGSLALYTPPRDEAGRERWDRHQTFAHHIMAEEWQKQPNGVYCWVAAGTRAGGRRRAPAANHWLDATAYAIAARNLRDLSTIRAPEPPPVAKPAEPTKSRYDPDRDLRPYLATERMTA
jgi:hypothetical protein